MAEETEPAPRSSPVSPYARCCTGSQTSQAVFLTLADLPPQHHHSITFCLSLPTCRTTTRNKAQIHQRIIKPNTSTRTIYTRLMFFSYKETAFCFGKQEFIFRFWDHSAALWGRRAAWIFGCRGTTTYFGWSFRKISGLKVLFSKRTYVLCPDRPWFFECFT